MTKKQTWQDTTSYWRRSDGGEPSEYTADLGNGIRVVLHHKIYDPERWFVSCAAIGVDDHRLDEVGVAKARTEALQVVLERAEDVAKRLRAAVNREP